jgi:hypothetical protein
LIKNKKIVLTTSNPPTLIADDMIHHLSPPTGLEPGTSSFTRVNPYSSLPQEAIPQGPSICITLKKINIPFSDL